MTSPQPNAITRPPVELYGTHAGYGFAGLGVNTAIGNFTLTSADLLFPGGLLGLLNWQRTYNSRSGAVGALGPGWSVSLSARLVPGAGAGEPVTFNDEDGRVLTFTPAAGGGFTRPQDLQADLARNQDGSFTLTYSTGLTWSFDATGRLTERSMEGQTVSLEYGSDDLLQRAQHAPSGRQLSFSYDANRRLVSVAASDGRTVTFGYSAGDVTSALLESVTDPGAGVTAFQWSGTGQAAQISQITTADGNLGVTNVYNDPRQRVTSQAFPGGGGAEFAYDDPAGVSTVTSTPSGGQVTFQADAQGRMIKATDPAGNAATFSYNADGYLTDAVTPGGTEVSQARDQRGNVTAITFGGATTTWDYDDLDRVTSTTGPDGAVTSYAYPGASRIPSAVTDANGAVMRFTVSDGLLLARTNADGNTFSFGYDAAGNMVSVTNPLAEVSRFGYDPAGNLIQQTTPSDQTTSFSYDSAGRLTGVTNPASQTSSYRYSPGGLLLEITDATGASTVNAYDEAGRLTSVTDTLGRATVSTFDSDGNLATVTGPDGGVSRAAYDVLNRLTGVTGPDGSQVSYAYDADGRRLTTTTASGTTHYAYDTRGNLVSVTDPTEATVTLSYDTASRLTAQTDADGGVWRTSYDPVGNVTATTDPAGGTSSYVFTPAGRLAAVIDPLGRRVSYSYDGTGRVTQATDAQGGVTTYVYDPDGRPSSVTTPAGLTQSFRYDSAGRLTELVDPRGWITRFQYNARGEETAVITPSGALRRRTYDAAGQLTEVIDANGSTTRYGYDNAGHLTTITDAKGSVTRLAYNAAGRQVSSTDPLDRTTQREYDQAGNLIAVTDPAGRVLRMDYDAGRRLTRRTGADGATASFAYTKAGRLASMTDSTGTTRYGYDAAGRMTAITEPDGGVFTLRYDRAGQRTALGYPDGLQLSYDYNGNGRLTRLHDSRAGDAVYAVDPDGRLLTEQLPGRLARRYHYEHGLLHRFTVIRDDELVSETEFTRDPDGRIKAERTGDAFRDYRFDPAGQLVSALYRGPEPGRRDELSIRYDVVGNRESIRAGEAQTRYRYDAADQLLAAESGGRRTEFRYDESGRLIEEREGESRRRIDYDGLGHPVRVTVDRDGRQETIQAVFDGTGLLSSVVITDEDRRDERTRQASARYQWSPGRLPQILTQRAEPALDDAERDRPGRLNADFAYGYGRTFGSWEHGAAAFHTDAFGSAIRTDDTEDWVQAGHYTLFGAPDGAARDEEHGEEDRPRPPELPRFGYRGELARGPAIYLRGRCYDAALGRFTTRDPAYVLTGPSQARNPYVYCNNDPLNLVDPLGTLAFGFDGLLAVLGALGGGFAQDCDTGNCRHPANTLDEHLRCVQGKVCLCTRGFYGGVESALDGDDLALNTLWSKGQRERAAQAVAIKKLNTNRIGFWGKAENFIRGILNWGGPSTPTPPRSHPNVSQDVDWELGQRYQRPPQAPGIPGIRTDIVTGADKNPSWLFEVKQFYPGAEAEVTGQLARYQVYAASVYGIDFAPGVELLTFVDTFTVNFDYYFFFTAGGTQVFVWGLGNPPGHIYFATDKDTNERVKNRSTELLQPVLSNYLTQLLIAEFQGQNPALAGTVTAPPQDPAPPVPVRVGGGDPPLDG